MLELESDGEDKDKELKYAKEEIIWQTWYKGGSAKGREMGLVARPVDKEPLEIITMGQMVSVKHQDGHGVAVRLHNKRKGSYSVKKVVSVWSEAEKEMIDFYSEMHHSSLSW